MCTYVSLEFLNVYLHDYTLSMLEGKQNYTYVHSYVINVIRLELHKQSIEDYIQQKVYHDRMLLLVSLLLIAELTPTSILMIFLSIMK